MSSSLVVFSVLIISFFSFDIIALVSWASVYKMESPQKGWHASALDNPRPSPESFVPTLDDLAFIVTQNGQVEHRGYTVAFFSQGDGGTNPNPIAVDAMGRVLSVPQGTFSHLSSLATRISSDLPPTGSLMNVWRIKTPVTSRPIDRLFSKLSSGELKETSVQGYTAATTDTELTTPVGEYTHLPDLLKDFFALALEARDGYERNGADRTVIEKVKKAANVD